MAELGNKHECLSCSTKFYDLGKNELICPKCGADQKELAEAGEEKPAKKSKKKKSTSKSKSPVKAESKSKAKKKKSAVKEKEEGK